MVEIVDKAESLIAYEFSLTQQSSFDDVGAAIIGESRRRGYTRDESIACVSTGIQESGLRPSAVSPNGVWRGIYQQDASYPDRDDPTENIWAFLDRLDVKRRSPGASPDIWLNIFWLQQRPGEPSADAAYRNGRQAYLTEIKRHTARAAELYDRLSAGTPTADRPDYNEYPMWSPNCSSRGGRTVDLFLLHTQEGDGNADSLARFLQNPANEVSYHYTVSEDSNDHGVTVVDVVDTDDASWSVLSANSRSINLCFAGSHAAWSRDQWLKQSRAIDVAAYLAVQDCKRYGISTRVVAPPYNSTPGISDHQYVTKVLKDGSHSDVGPNFPWDVFAASVAKYSNQTPAPAPAPAPARQFPKDFTDHELLEWIVAQLGPGDPAWQSKGMTLRDKVWSLDSDAS